MRKIVILVQVHYTANFHLAQRSKNRQDANAYDSRTHLLHLGMSEINHVAGRTWQRIRHQASQEFMPALSKAPHVGLTDGKLQG